MSTAVATRIEQVDAGMVRVAYYDSEDGRFLGYGYIGQNSWPKPVADGDNIVWVNEDGSPATA